MSGRFQLGCGHWVQTNPLDPFAWLRAAQSDCMRCHLESKGAAKDGDEAAVLGERRPGDDAGPAIEAYSSCVPIATF